MKQKELVKRFFGAIMSSFVPVLLLGQTQYDYYDDSAVAGGVDRALKGIIIIGGIIVVVVVILFLLYIISKIYFFFNPKADPEYIRDVAEKEKKKKHEDYIQEQRKNASPIAIDLGLSVKWASFNLGAYCPSDVGVLFYWGDNKPSKRGNPRFRKVNVNTVGNIGGKPEFDAATNSYGENWRMPTESECKELIESCVWKADTIDGVDGKTITGPNGNSIFLPFNENHSSEKNDYAHYWTSCPSFRDGLKESAQNLRFGQNCKEPAELSCASVDYAMFSIRPVYSTIVVEKEIETKNIIASFRQINTSEITELNDLYETYEERCQIKEDEKNGSSLWGIFFNREKTYTDRYGVVYSIDRKRLLDGEKCDCEVYEIMEGTEIVCNGAFCTTLANRMLNRKESKLKKIILPSSLCYLPISALPDSCEIVSNNVNYSSINNLLIDNRKRSIVKCLDHYIQKVIIGDPIVEIEEYAFLNCIALREVILPSSLKTIGKSSFRNCEMLNTINLHDSILTIADEAFFNCPALHIKRLPNQLLHLGSAAFKLCNLHDSIIPKSLIDIGDKPFPRECHNLTSNSTRFIIKDSLLIDTRKNELIQLIDAYVSVVSVPEGIVKIRASAFAHTDITNITFPSSIIELDHGVFWGCKKLTNVQLNNNITILPNSTFAYCELLSSVIIPDSIEVLGCGAFYNCKNLHELTLNKGLRVIESRTFEGCENLVSLNISENVERIGDIYGINCFKACNKLNEINYDAKEATLHCMHKNMFHLNIGNHVKILPCNLLSNNNTIESLVVPENVERIQKGCVVECKNLKEITILSHNITLEDGWLRKCEGLRTIRIQQDVYNQLLPLIPQNVNLKVKKIYKHQFLFFKW